MTHIVDIVVCLQLEHNIGQDQLIAVLGSDQAIMRKIQSRVVSRLVVLLGIRWSSSLHRGQVGPIVQNIVVQGALGGVSTDAKYKELKAASVKGDFHFLQQIQQTQNKTAKQHRDKIQEIITALFEDTTDPMVNDIKKDLFDVPSGGSIVPREHRVMAEMMALPLPVLNGVHPSPHTPHTLRTRTTPASQRASPPRPLPRAPSPAPPPPPLSQVQGPQAAQDFTSTHWPLICLSLQRAN